MEENGARRRTSRWIVLTSIVCAAAIGLVVIVESASNGPDHTARLTLWWTAYALFMATLLAIHGWLPSPRALAPHILLGALIVLAALLVLLIPDQTWMLALFVMTAAMASFFWPPSAVVVLIVAQVSLILGIGVVDEWPVTELVLVIVGFGNFQVFGALVVFAVRRETQARDELAVAHAQLAVAHAELRGTAALLELTTREAERLRISRDLHDLAGHDLTALSLELEVATHLTADTSSHDHVQRAKSIAKDLLSTIRAAVGAMRSTAPALEPALLGLTAGTPGVDISVRVDPELALDADRVIVILRTVQEAITNILRHSGANNAQVAVQEEGCDVLVTISDHGRGAEHIVPGNGLTGMRERFEVLGGNLEVTSIPGRGTTISGRLPQRSPASSET